MQRLGDDAEPAGAQVHGGLSALRLQRTRVALVAVAVAVPVAARQDLRLVVEHDAVDPVLLEPRDRALDRRARRAARADHEQEAVEQVLQRDGVRHRARAAGSRRRRSRSESWQAPISARHALGAEQLRPRQPLAPGREHREPGGRDRAHRHALARAPQSHSDDAAGARQAQVALDRGLAQVGLEQQHALRATMRASAAASPSATVVLPSLGPVLTTPIVVKRLARERRPPWRRGSGTPRPGSARCRAPPAAAAARTAAAGTLSTKRDGVRVAHRRPSARCCGPRPRFHGSVPAPCGRAPIRVLGRRRRAAASPRAARWSRGFTYGITASSGQPERGRDARPASFNVGSSTSTTTARPDPEQRGRRARPPSANRPRFGKLGRSGRLRRVEDAELLALLLLLEARRPSRRRASSTAAASSSR